MKKVFFALALAATGPVFAQSPAAPQQGQVDAGKTPRFKFDKEVFDFGNVKEGPTAEHVFTFKNTGKTPLIITNASASCGCTTPEWPKQPILPGKSGKIVVRYDTKNRVGPFDKAVYIQSNAFMPPGKGDRYELKIKGTVVAAKQ